MASDPQRKLPLFYRDIMPLNSREHRNWHNRPTEAVKWLINQHAVPLTVEEFLHAQLNFPIVFSSGDNPMPLALMGLNEGINTFVDEEGKLAKPVYLPAYVRRYPFLLAKVHQSSDELSLCFDPTSELLGEFEEGDALFDSDGQPNENTKNILEFCERFEKAGVRTKSFVDELIKHELLRDGQIDVSQSAASNKQLIYRGFQIVDQEKLREVSGDLLRSWNENGFLRMIHAHLSSLGHVPTILSRQLEQGKVSDEIGASAGV